MARSNHTDCRQRALHQHDLQAAAVRRIVAIAAPRATDLIWEPGAGTGAITMALLAAGCRVTAVEIDRIRATALHRTATAAGQADRLDLVVDDLRRAALPSPGPWQMIGNPPFMCTAALLRRLFLEADPLPERMTLVLHSEAARKWAPPAGQGTHSGVIAQLCGQARCGPTLARDATHPPSHVPLCLWTWHRHDTAPSRAERQAVDRLLEHAFAGPHTVRDALRHIATVPILRRQGQRHGWHLNDHPRRLAARAWLELTRFLVGIGRLGDPPQ